MTRPTVYLHASDPLSRRHLAQLAAPLDVISLDQEPSARMPAGLHPPGCLVLDMSLDAPRGLALQADLMARGVGLPVIAITAHGEVATAVAAAKAGAVAVFDRPLAAERVAQAIHQAIEVDRRNQCQAGQSASIARRIDGLSAHERTVLELVVAGNPNKVIAARLGYSLRSVEAWRSKVMKVLGARSLADLVRLWLAARVPAPHWNTLPATVTHVEELKTA
ncbi:MAG: LuxR C-terminal-related transcriptional regulator [Pirellulales bacterium]